MADNTHKQTSIVIRIFILPILSLGREAPFGIRGRHLQHFLNLRHVEGTGLEQEGWGGIGGEGGTRGLAHEEL